MSINRVNITGRLVRNPELKNAGGATILTFSVAVEDPFRKNGEWDKYTNFFDCVMFGDKANGWSQRLFKGSQVTIEGKLHQSRFQTKEGKNASKVEIKIEKVETPYVKKEQQSNPYENADIPF